MPTSLPPPDPDAVVLCQIPGMEPALLLRLLERWESAAAILQAPSSELRGAGLAPALVAKIVAAPRQRAATLASLKSLERMRIVPVPFLAPGYPARLRDLPNAPLLLYVQGKWPAATPAVAFTSLDTGGERRQLVAQLLLSLARVGVACLATDELELLPADDSIALLGFGLLLSRHRIPEALRTTVGDDRATLISVAPINAQPAAGLAEVARSIMLALADGLLLAGAAIPDPARLRPDLHVWSLDPGIGPGGRTVKHIRPGEAGAQAIARSLGVRVAGSATVEQKQLW